VSSRATGARTIKVPKSSTMTMTMT
jgi:hypothetical protein